MEGGMARLGTWLLAALLLAGCPRRGDDAVDTDVPETDVVDTVVDSDTDVVDTVVVDSDTDAPVESDPPVAECDDADDCRIHDGCCDCLPLPVRDPGPGCDLPECFATACTGHGLSGVPAACAAGRCVFDLSCDQAEVQCRRLTPPCPSGQVPSVVDHCWGACVPVDQCRRVTDCGVCAAAGKVCVSEIGRALPIVHCVDAPAGCTDCGCLGATVCQQPYGLCEDVAPGELGCNCPTCR